MTDKIMVLVTCGSAKAAQRIGRALVKQRLAACANIFRGRVLSIYRWKGNVESAREVMIMVKTSRKRFAAVERAVRKLHGYEVPEIIAVPIAEGSLAYLKWISDSVGSAGRR